MSSPATTACRARRLPSRREFARLSLFLTTPAARHITGQTLHVSHGALAQLRLTLFRRFPAPIATVGSRGYSNSAFQIPNFSYGTGVEKLFPTVIAQAQEAEAAGFDSVFVMDHFYQLPMLGPPDQPMLEAYTALGALATATERLQLGTLVTGNTYRNPTLLAKTITTLDVVSAGRAILGIGAGWFELEHRPARLRVRHVHRPVQPARRGAADHPADDQGRTAHVLRQLVPHRIGDGRAAFPRPRPDHDRRRRREEDVRDRRPHCDHLNIIAGLDELPRKVDALKARCEEAGRDPATLETSLMLTVVIDENIDPAKLPGRRTDAWWRAARPRSPSRSRTKILDVGVGGVIINLPNGHVPGVITTAAEALRPLLGL